MTDVSNADIFGALMEIKEDIGGLKSTTQMHLKALENFSPRLNELEQGAAKQKGAIKVWGIVATGAASLAAAVIQALRH